MFRALFNRVRPLALAVPKPVAKRHRRLKVEWLEARTLLAELSVWFSNESVAMYEGELFEDGILFYLSQPESEEVSVAYDLIGVSATSGSDFVADSGVITFEPGEWFHHRDVETLDDALVENTESFKVVLSSPVNATQRLQRGHT